MGVDDGSRRGDAVAMLQQSHRRLTERLAELRAAAEAIPGGDPGGEALDVIDDVAGYLGRSAARHEADEERSLFPRLAASPELAPLLATLTAEHREHEALHGDLCDLADRLRQPDATDDDRAAVAALAAELERRYTAHLEREETELFPAASTLLGAPAMAEILAEMEARRGGGGGGRGRGGGGRGRNRR